jgi:hypothetical protein
MTNKNLAKLMKKYKNRYAFYLINRFGGCEAQKINAKRLHVYMESFVWPTGFGRV